MFRMLDLLLRAAKCCLVLTIVRLLTSAFGCEFGISRQYLRLLEWILSQGQKRIERCESEQRLQQSNSFNGRHPSESSIESEAERPKGLRLPSNSSGGGGGDLRRTVSTDGGSEEFKSGEDPSDKEKHKARVSLGALNGPLQQSLNERGSRAELVAAEQHKRRRVSTPNGPPVFLFDDDDDDDDSDDLDEQKQQQQQQDSRGRAGLAMASGKGGSEGNLGELAATGGVQAHTERKHEFHLEDAARLVVRGISAIIDDEVTKRFAHEQLKTWNLLTRTNAKNYQFMSRSLGFWWVTGLIIRYAILMPLRIMFTLIGFVWLISTMPLVGILPRALRDRPHQLVSLMAFRMLSCGVNSRLKFHNREHRAQRGSICVANHTSPLDVVLLASDNCYTLVGQRHGGLLGLLQVALSRAANHIWFERGAMRDRQLVAARLREHVSVSSNLPILIFPEGTCINNSAVMMFRKGSFEVTDRIYPVAIKYDARFGDPFWNSSKQSYVQYLLMIMSAWAIKCEVWYLKPMDRLEGEDSAEFANRVKAEIARQAGLENLAWDGQLKRTSVKPTWLFQQQEDYVRRLKLE